MGRPCGTDWRQSATKAAPLWWADRGKAESLWSKEAFQRHFKIKFEILWYTNHLLGTDSTWQTHLETETLQRGQMTGRTTTGISHQPQTSKKTSNTHRGDHSMPTLSSTVQGKDWIDQPPTHSSTHPTVMAAMVIVESTDKQEWVNCHLVYI